MVCFFSVQRCHKTFIHVTSTNLLTDSKYVSCPIKNSQIKKKKIKKKKEVKENGEGSDIGDGGGFGKKQGKVISLYRQLLRSLNSPEFCVTWAARLSKKAEVRAIFSVASEDHSLHNISDLIDVAEYSLSLLRQGQLPKFPL